MKNRGNTIWGILLILGGLLFLARSTNLLGSWADSLWSMMGTAALALGSLAFLIVFLSDLRGSWWAAIPGFTLFGLFITTVAENFGSLAEAVSGGFFLASIGLGFLAVYLVNRDEWWPLIPFGVMTTLGVVATTDELATRWEMTNFDSAPIFFIGLGLTFLLIALLNLRNKSMRWAYIPAAALLILGLLIGSSLENLANYIWPLALIIGGIILLLRR